MRDTDTRLLYALRSIFRPLANILLKNRIGIAPIIEQLKLAFVEAARANHGKSGKPATINRIAQLTGMSRQHVSQILEQAKRSPMVESMPLPLEAGVLGTWFGNDKYLDDVGLPKALPLGPGPGTFRSLVEECADAEEAQNTVDSLLKSSAVEVRPDGKIMMTNRAFPICDDLPRILAVWLSPLCSTINKNWGHRVDEGLTLRVAHTRRLDSRKIAVVRRISRERISHFVEEIDDVLCSYEVDNQEPILDTDGNELSRVGVGVYYFEMEK